MTHYNEENAIRIMRYGEWKWSEILYIPTTQKFIKKDYEEEYLDTGTNFLGETELTFEEVFETVKSSVEALLKLQEVSGINLKKEIEKINK